MDVLTHRSSRFLTVVVLSICTFLHTLEKAFPTAGYNEKAVSSIADAALLPASYMHGFIAEQSSQLPQLLSLKCSPKVLTVLFFFSRTGG